MLATIGNRSGPFRHKLLVGAVATLSRNFQLHFLRDMIADKEVEVIIRSGSLGELLEKLEAHQLDLVLTNTAVHSHANSLLRIQLVDKQAVNLLRHPRLSTGAHFNMTEELAGIPLILSTQGNGIRTAFDLLVERTGVQLTIAAEPMIWQCFDCLPAKFAVWRCCRQWWWPTNCKPAP